MFLASKERKRLGSVDCQAPECHGLEFHQQHVPVTHFLFDNDGIHDRIVVSEIDSESCGGDIDKDVTNAEVLDVEGFRVGDCGFVGVGGVGTS